MLIIYKTFILTICFYYLTQFSVLVIESRSELIELSKEKKFKKKLLFLSADENSNIDIGAI